MAEVKIYIYGTAEDRAKTLSFISNYDIVSLNDIKDFPKECQKDSTYQKSVLIQSGFIIDEDFLSYINNCTIEHTDVLIFKIKDVLGLPIDGKIADSVERDRLSGISCIASYSYIISEIIKNSLFQIQDIAKELKIIIPDDIYIYQMNNQIYQQHLDSISYIHDVDKIIKSIKDIKNNSITAEAKASRLAQIALSQRKQQRNDNDEIILGGENKPEDSSVFDNESSENARGIIHSSLRRRDQEMRIKYNRGNNISNIRRFPLPKDNSS